MEEGKAREAGIRTYIVIWAALIVFIGLTLTSADLNLGRISIIICLCIAAIKSTLVLLYFMRLRYQKMTLIKLVVPIAIIVLAIFIGLTYSDVVAR